MHIQAMEEAFDFDNGLLLAVQGVQVRTSNDQNFEPYVLPFRLQNLYSLFVSGAAECKLPSYHCRHR